MKKVKLIISAVAMMALVASSTVHADGFAPGEGLYIGGFAALTTGLVQPRVVAAANGEGSNPAATYATEEGGLGLQGIEGGVQLGYGYKMGDLYAGLEGEWAAGDVEFKVTTTTAMELRSHGVGASAGTGTQGSQEYTIAAGTVVSAAKDWTGGMFGRIGYYLSPDTLVAFRGGVLVSKFDVAFGSAFTETFYGGGPAFGVDMQSKLGAIDPNLNLRLGAVYTDYLTAPVSGIGTMLNSESGDGSTNSEVTGEELSARIGLTYSFFDVNSLF